MDTPTSPVDPCAAPAAPRLPRPVRILVWSLLALAGVTTLAVTGAVVHARANPDFWTYVKDVRASDDLVRPLPGQGRVLASSGELQLGDGAPFAAPEEGRELAQVDFVLTHGEEELLRLRHTTAWTYGPDGAARTSLALRTEQLTTHPEMRARVRIGLVGADRLVGPDSARAGGIVYDVQLLAGGGESTLETVELHGWPGLAEVEAGALTATPLDGLLPWRTVPGGGYVAHLRQDLRLTASRTSNGGQSIGIGDAEYAASTGEYDYGVEVDVHAGAWNRKWTRTFHREFGFHPN